MFSVGLGYFQKLEDIEVWKRGCKLVVAVYKLVESEGLSRKWSLKDQMSRAALSVPSNIAEGYERDSRAEFRRFLLIAKGSCGELCTQLYVTKAMKLIEGNEVDRLLQERTEISSMLKSMARSLEK